MLEVKRLALSLARLHGQMGPLGGTLVPFTIYRLSQFRKKVNRKVGVKMSVAAKGGGFQVETFKCSFHY